MTPNGTKHRLVFLGITAVALLAVIVASGLSGLPPRGSVGVVSGAPAIQGTVPVVSFSGSTPMVRESQTVDIEAVLNQAATSEIEVGYTVSWPTGRTGIEQGALVFEAGDTTASTSILIRDDDTVAASTRETITVTLIGSDDDSYNLDPAHTKDLTVLEGVCDRSEKVRERIMGALDSVTECHQVTEEHLATDLPKKLYWANGKLKGSKLKPGDFRGMTNVTHLYLGSNELGELPSGVFDGLDNLRVLYAAKNSIISLPPRIFKGLGKLDELGLKQNGGSTDFTLVPRLKRLDDNTFVLEVIEGAPFDIEVTLTANGGTASAEMATVPAGKLISAPITLTREAEEPTVGVTVSTVKFRTVKAHGIVVEKGDTLNLPRPVVSVVTGADVSVKEGESAGVPISISPAPKVPFNLKFSIEYDDGDPDTIGGDSDDHGPEMPVQIPAGTTSGSIPVVIAQDSDIDDGAREVLVFQLEVNEDDPDYVLGAEISRTVTIKEGICDRTKEVQLAILDALPETKGYCEEVTDDQLSKLPGPLDLSSNDVASLKGRDFMGLANLTGIDISNATITSLPSGVFNGLESLTSLSLQNGKLAALDHDVFSGLTTLKILRLDTNKLAALPNNVFRGLTELETLEVADNDLTSLPNGIFEGLRSLLSIDFSDNEGSPFELTAELVERPSTDSDGGFAVAILMASGTPANMKIGLTATHAVPSETLPSMGAGETESPAIPFDWTGTADATITITDNGFNFPGNKPEGLEFVAGPPLVSDQSRNDRDRGDGVWSGHPGY